MSSRFIGFFLSAVLISSIYTTADFEVYSNNNIYDVLLQDALFVIDYFLLSGYFVLTVFNKNSKKNSFFLFPLAYFILFLVGFCMPYFLRKSSDSYYLVYLVAITGRMLQILAFLFILSKENLQNIFTKKLLKEPFTYVIILIPMVFSVSDYYVFDIIYLETLLLLFFVCYIIHKEYHDLGWPFVAGLIVLFLTELYYLQKFETSEPILYLLLFRILSSVAELLIAKGFVDLAMSSSTKR